MAYSDQLVLFNLKDYEDGDIIPPGGALTSRFLDDLSRDDSVSFLVDTVEKEIINSPSSHLASLKKYLGVKTDDELRRDPKVPYCVYGTLISEGGAIKECFVSGKSSPQIFCKVPDSRREAVLEAYSLIYSAAERGGTLHPDSKLKII